MAAGLLQKAAQMSTSVVGRTQIHPKLSLHESVRGFDDSIE
jgi:hypothetical protein